MSYAAKNSWVFQKKKKKKSIDAGLKALSEFQLGRYYIHEIKGGKLLSMRDLENKSTKKKESKQSKERTIKRLISPLTQPRFLRQDLCDVLSPNEIASTSVLLLGFFNTHFSTFQTFPHFFSSSSSSPYPNQLMLNYVDLNPEKIKARKGKN